jgi:hypothetical protein
MMMKFLLHFCCVTIGVGRGVESWAAMDDESYGNLCAAASARLRRNTGSLPWSDGWLGTVLGSHDVVPTPGGEFMMPVIPVVAASSLSGQVPVERPAVVPPSMSGSRGLFTKDRPAKGEAEKRPEALSEWRSIVKECGASCGLGRQLATCVNDEESEATFELRFELKRTATLRARSGSMRMYMVWARTCGEAAFPLTERAVFSYMLHLVRTAAPATRASRFREALAFCRTIIALDGVDAVLDSARVAGAAARTFESKRLLRKRDPLKHLWVALLEKLCVEAPDGRTRVFCGFVCFCLHTRARWSDAQAVFEEPCLDADVYIEARTARTKTSNVKHKRRRPLSLVGHAQGVSGVSWAEGWLAARRIEGLTVNHNVPLMPAPSADGGWTTRPVDTEEAGVWLRQILSGAGVEDVALSNVGTHSLKATMLSWAGKAGLPANARRVLGYHAVPKDHSVQEYSRDEIAEPLRMLGALLVKIRDNEFDPDATRSGRWVRTDVKAGTPALPMPRCAKSAAPVGQANLVCAPCSPEARADMFFCDGALQVWAPEAMCPVTPPLRIEIAPSESSDEVCCVSADDSDDDPERARFFAAMRDDEAARSRAPAGGADNRTLAHKVLKTIHRGRDDDMLRTACGREITAMFQCVSDVDDDEFSGAPRCRVCYGTAGHGS